MRSFRFFLATLMLLALALPNAFSQTSTWDGTAVSWTHGTGTQADPYLIESAQNLAYIAEMVNGGVNQYSGKYFKLTVDIDLDSLEWSPIGNYNTSSAIFKGNFDGDNHTIDKLKINSTTLQYGGLFGYVDGSIFQNVNIGGRITRSSASNICYFGSIAGYAYSTVTIENCSNSGNVSSTATSSNPSCSGGLIGYAYSAVTISNCSNSGNVLSVNSGSKSSYSGGLIGCAYGTISISNCSNSGNVSSTATSAIYHPYSGGLIGYANSTVSISNCSNSGNVSATLSSTSTSTMTGSELTRSYSSYSGGIVGNIETKATITQCVNTGNISSSASTAGKGYSSSILLNTYSYSGGIVGYSNANSSSKNSTILLCYNNGAVSSTASNSAATNYSKVYSYSGGLLGYGVEPSYNTINNSYNRGTVTATAQKTAGSSYYQYAYGYASGIGYNGISTNCYNTGTLTTPTTYCSHIYKYGIGNSTTTNSYYLETCGSNGGNGTSKTEEAMKSESFPILLNPEAFVMDLSPNVNDGYPIFGSSVCNVITEPVTNIDFTTATMNGSYNNGEFWNGTVDMQGFEWKEASASEWITVYTNVESPASYNLTGLTIGTTYNYRMFVKIGDMTIYGNTVDFTTRACNAAVVLTADNTTICNNTNTTIHAGRPWSSGSISSYSWSTGESGAAITANTAGTYAVTVTDVFNCTASASIDISTIPAPTAGISGNTYICTGNSTTLTASGGVGYVWSTGATTPSINVSETGEYYVIARASNDCKDTAYINVANFAEVVISGNTSICQGESTTLSVSEATSYLWSTGATTQSIQVTDEGLYSVTATNSTCEAHTSVYVAVNALPTATISGTTAICGGASTTLTANGGTSYAWNNGANTQSIEASSAGAYTVTVTNATGCTASAVTSVVSAPNPSVQISGNLTACQGESVTLTASGGTSYNWSNSANTASINPTQSGTYIVTAYNVLGCEATASADVVISPNPQLNITAPQTICNNGSTILSVSDNLGTTLTSCVWSNGGSGTSISVSPTATTNYTVTVTNSNGCTAQASTSVAVAEQLSLSLAGNTSICGNESATLTVSGISPSNVSTYAWSNGANTASVSVSASGTYSVIVTDVNGCTGYATTTVSAAENPVASISGQQSICSGSSATLLANGGTSYQWSDGSTDASISVTTGGTYTVVVTNGAGCTATASTMVTVNESPSPQINGTLSICEGESTTLSVTGGDSFVWSNGSISANINVTSSGNYSVIASNSNGCTASASATVNVMENPTVTISGEPSMCVGGATYLTAEGGVSYVWSNGFQGSSINVSEAGTYSVIATGTNGCTSSASMAVVQYSAPEVTISGNTTVCEGSNETLTASGGVSYVWSTGETSSAISVNAFGIYSVTATSNGGCSSTANVTVFVAPTPNPVINGNLHICDGEPTTLTANGGETYMWSNGSTANSIDVSNGGTYSVIATNANGCTAMASASVVAGYSVTNAITETTDGEFVWNGQTYTESGNYVQTFTAANGCDSVVTLHLTVNSVQHYNIFVISNNNAYGTTTGTGVYEANTEIQISATANDGYEFLSWNDGNTDTLRTITVTGDATYIATFIPATNIEENVALEIALFPNPATDILNITSSETISEIEIVNTLGQVVKRIEANSDNVICDVEGLKAGVYVVRIHAAKSDTSTTLSVRRFVKE
ncbi:MAG: T9SS type A sorting domain-containing protein [Bacteroidales bacterium]|nr:T9SS type A sorting domain-containing protein [Bacteroidales bacterium]